MTSGKTDKKLELKVKRVLKTSVRGGVTKYSGEIVAGSAVVQTLPQSEEGQSAVASSKRSGSYGSRMPTDVGGAISGIVGGGGFNASH
ncbi:MAG: hypothetical protein M3020_25445 [Myxococcota bacterium]|nr:hypothetical protein [Myxococcota bacterium]